MLPILHIPIEDAKGRIVEASDYVLNQGGTVHFTRSGRAVAIYRPEPPSTDDLPSAPVVDAITPD